MTIARLALPSGQELRAPRSDSCRMGGGMLFIRPERVEIAPGTRLLLPSPQRNVLAGRVRRCSFLGNILRYAVDVDGVAPVTVDLQNAVGVDAVAGRHAGGAALAGCGQPDPAAPMRNERTARPAGPRPPRELRRATCTLLLMLPALAMLILHVPGAAGPVLRPHVHGVRRHHRRVRRPGGGPAAVAGLI